MNLFRFAVRGLVALASGVMLLPACGREPILKVIVDTDMALPRDRESDPSIAPAATMEHLRVDMVLEGGGDAIEFLTNGEHAQDFRLTPTTPWPLSFVVREGNLGETYIRMRIRAYPSASLGHLFDLDEKPVDGLALDRLVYVPLPQSDDDTIRVFLSSKCFGITADYENGATCVDDPTVLVPATEGIERGEGEPAKTASAEGIRKVPCSAAPPKGDAVCIEGAITIRGDDAFEEVDQTANQFSARRHLVRLKPFFIDRKEVTVARFRSFAKTLDPIQLPNPRSATNPACTWTADVEGREELPLNCLSFKTARAFCVASGGDLPTDAQWEHAARGGRLRDPYVWGKREARCCAGKVASTLGCGGVDPAPVGSFTDPARCDGLADVTESGIADLAGNVREMVLDGAWSYDHPKCPLTGVNVDPVCEPDDAIHITRGGSFRSSFDLARIGIRTGGGIGDDLGFRCAYPGTP